MRLLAILPNRFWPKYTTAAILTANDVTVSSGERPTLAAAIFLATWFNGNTVISLDSRLLSRAARPAVVPMAWSHRLRLLDASSPRTNIPQTPKDSVTISSPKMTLTVMFTVRYFQKNWE